ncbi:MAG: GCAxxG family protein [Firmicutes bacterium]|nr:GCAxxG family protein [Bacillota bacterium]
MIASDQSSVKQIAGQYFKEGYNCSEAVLRAFRDQFHFDLSDEAMKLASGFGGGIGHAGCVCGALAASIMVLGMLEGRSHSSQDRDRIYHASEEFHRRFSEKFGGSCCRMLNPHPFETKDHLRNCLKLTGNTAELLNEYIQEKQLQRTK